MHPNPDDQPPVELLTIGETVRQLERYDCGVEVAQRFAAEFRQALDRFPGDAVEILKANWAQRNGPRVSVIRGPGAWGGRGWAALVGDGYKLFFASQIVVAIPSDFLQTFVAHECGHALCLAVREPSHFVLNEKARPEWLIWQLMDEWGFDQPAAELWAYQHIEVVDGSARIRNVPLGQEEAMNIRDRDRQKLLDLLHDQSIPAELQRWLPR